MEDSKLLRTKRFTQIYENQSQNYLYLGMYPGFGGVHFFRKYHNLFMDIFSKNDRIGFQKNGEGVWTNKILQLAKVFERKSTYSLLNFSYKKSMGSNNFWRHPWFLYNPRKVYLKLFWLTSHFWTGKFFSTHPKFFYSISCKNCSKIWILWFF